MERFNEKILIIAVIAIIAISMSACKTDDSGPDFDGGTVELGDTLKISGQVYICDLDAEYFPHYHPYNGATYSVFTPTVETGQISTGQITNGKFNLSLGTPSPMFSFLIEDLGISEPNYKSTNVPSSPPQSLALKYLVDCGKSPYCVLSRENNTVENKNGTIYWANEWVTYVFVNTDATVSGEGGTYKNIIYEEGIEWDQTTITTDFNFTLKKGWNSVYHFQGGSYTINNNTKTAISTITNSISLSNPPLRWVFWACEEHD